MRLGWFMDMCKEGAKCVRGWMWMVSREVEVVGQTSSVKMIKHDMTQLQLNDDMILDRCLEETWY